jgi:hypothetical protein
MADMLDKNAEIVSDHSVPEIQKAADDMYKLRYEFTEADEVEDAILFPKLANRDIPNRSPRYKSAIEKFQMGKLRAWKIGYDLSTDEDSSGSDSDSEYEYEYDGDEVEIHENARLETDSNPKSAPLQASGRDVHKHLFEKDQQGQKQRSGPLVPQFEWVANTQDPLYFLPIVRDPARAWVIPTELKTPPSTFMYTLRTALRRHRVYNKGGYDVGKMIESHSQRSNDRGTFTVSGSNSN